MVCFLGNKKVFFCKLVLVVFSMGKYTLKSGLSCGKSSEKWITNTNNSTIIEQNSKSVPKSNGTWRGCWKSNSKISWYRPFQGLEELTVGNGLMASVIVAKNNSHVGGSLRKTLGMNRTSDFRKQWGRRQPHPVKPTVLMCAGIMAMNWTRALADLQSYLFN